MRVVIVTGIFPPDIGGPATHASDLRDALVERGHRVVVLTLSDEASGMTRQPGVVRWPRSWPWPRRHAAVVRWIIRNRDRIDAIYATGMHPAAVGGARLAGLPSVVKIVGDPVWERGRRQGLTSAEFEEFQGSFARGVRVRLMTALRNATLREASAIVTPSDYLARTVEGWLGGPADVDVIANGVAAPPVASGERPEGLSVVFVGRLVAHKQVDLLIGAVAHTEGVALTVIGSGPEEQRLRDRSASLLVSDRVNFLGTLTHPEVLAVVAGADVLALASDYEGLPHVVLEALAVGTPVVAPPVGGVAEVVVDGENGLLVDATEERLGAALRTLRDEPESLRRLTDGAMRHGVMWRFALTADRIEAVLERIRRSTPRLVIVGKTMLDPTSADLRAKLGRMTAHADVALVQTGHPRLGAVGRSRVIVMPDGRPRALGALMFYGVAPVVAVGLASRRRPSAVVCRSPYEGVTATTAARFVPRSMRPSIVVEVHGDWRTASRLYGSRSRTALSAVTDRLAEGAILRADRVRTIGAYTESLVRGIGYRGTVDTFAAFRDFSAFLEDPPQAAGEPPLVAFLGGAAPVKGLDVLLRAWPSVASAVPRTKLEIAGAGLRSKLGDRGDVEIRGHLEIEDVRDLLDRASVVVMPSRSEGMGRVALEAHGRGRAVIASAVGGLPEVVEHGATGLLVPPEDPDALAEAIVTLLRDPDRARAMGRLGRDRVEQRSPSDEFERGIERLASWVSR